LLVKVKFTYVPDRSAGLEKLGRDISGKAALK